MKMARMYFILQLIINIFQENGSRLGAVASAPGSCGTGPPCAPSHRGSGVRDTVRRGLQLYRQG